MSNLTKYDRYVSGYSGSRLLQKHSLDEEGLWQIKGEDPNCDMGGSHVQPDLGIAHGKLRDVIEYAVELSGFWQWGSGGDIRKVENIIACDSASTKRRKELQAKKAELEKQLHEINDELDDHGGDAYV